MSTNIPQAYAGLTPTEVWRHFAALNAIPRPSGREEAAAQYVREVAAQYGAEARTDAFGNVIVYVAATSGLEGAPTIALQSHLDMVCEKREGVQHDFERDPILPRREGNLVYATGTTLGADNGMGAALALATLTQRGLRHGPLELLFTLEEETGLYGASALDASLLNSSALLNMDSEDPETLTIGCAGGAGVNLDLPRETESAPPGWQGYEVVVSGLKGGHSGVQIHEPLLNSLKVLTRVLLTARDSQCEYRLTAISGGNAHNAIPRDASARLAVAPEGAPLLSQAVSEVRAWLANEWGKDEPQATLELRRVDSLTMVLSDNCEKSLLRLLDALPHGIIQWSSQFPGIVETSANLAKVSTGEQSILIELSCRSFIARGLTRVQEEIKALGQAEGAQVEYRDGYPGWEPASNSRLLEKGEEVYKAVYGKAPKVEVIHAGLECGVIVSKKPGMEALSFGPLIQGAHTPEENIDASTVEPCWNYLNHLLEALASGDKS